MKKILILHNIRSAHNVGSLFRTADGAGVSHVFLTGYTPAPIDRFGRKRKDVAKVSLGAEEHLSWEKEKDILKLITELQKKGVHTVAVEQSPDAVSVYEHTPQENEAYILGNEVDGLSEDVLEAVDVIVEIPMRGEKESLNVSVAGGIVLYAKHGTRSA